MSTQPAEGQGSLLELPLSDPDRDMVGKAHARATDTERDAAARIMPKTGTQRRRVLQAIVMAEDGMTDAELEHLLGLRRSSICGRRHELLEGGWIRDSGKRRIDTQTGMATIVWALTGEGHEAVVAETEAYRHPGFNCAGEVR